MTSKDESVERGKENLRHPARETRRRAESGRGWYAWVARVGLVAKGISFAIVGILAIQLALGDGGKATSRQGALATIADESWGKILLVLLALGFAAYALWRFIQAFAERSDGDGDEAKETAKTWGKRAGYVGRGIIYASLTFTTVRLLSGSGGGGSQDQEAKRTTATVFDWPAGRWIVGIAGVAIVAAGLWNAYRGITKAFEEKWRTGQMSRTEQRWGRRVGVAGHLARGVVFGLIGVFITKAAIEHDPDDAIGLDGALQKLADTSYGPILLGVTAAGLLCYAAYCLVDARYRDVSANTGT